MVPPPTTNHIISAFVGGAFWEKIAAFRAGGLNACPRVRMALVIGNLLSPADQQESGRCVLISPSQVGSLTQKKNESMVGTLEKAMDCLRSAVSILKVECGKELGRCDARIVYHALGVGTKSADKRRFATLEDIIIEFFNVISKLNPDADISMVPAELRKEMRNLGPKGAAVDKKKKNEETEDEPPTVPATSSKGASCETLAEAKSKAFQASKLGFVQDAHVTRKRKQREEDGAPAIYKIMKIADAGARCKDIASGDAMTVQLNVLVSDYSLVSKLHTCVSEYEGQVPNDSAEFGVDLVKEAIKLQLFALAERHSAEAHASLWENPAQLKAKEKIAAKKLLLVPLTKSIGSREHTRDGSVYAIFAVSCRHPTKYLSNPSVTHVTRRVAVVCTVTWALKYQTSGPSISVKSHCRVAMML